MSSSKTSQKITLKSNLHFGNFPVYGSTEGFHSDEGCQFIINFKLQYEVGRLIMRFSKQSSPNIIPRDLRDEPTIELDLANIIKLIQSIKLRKEIIENASNTSFILIGSSTLEEYAGYQKPAYIRFPNKDKIVFNILHKGNQTLFEIESLFQIETFCSYLEQVQKVLAIGTMNFDFYRNHGIGSMLTAPEAQLN